MVKEKLRRMLAIICLLSVLGTVMAGCAQEKAPEAEILIEQRADPYITRAENGFYYFTASYPMQGEMDPEGYDRIILRRSKTLEGLKTAEEITIWDESSSDHAFRFIWAPELHQIGGKWYIYYAASVQRDNVWEIRCHVLMCEGNDPYTDRWVEKGPFQAAEGDAFSFQGFSLDMTYFACNGRHYVVWAQKEETSNLYLAEIDPSQPWKAVTASVLLSSPQYRWEKVSIPVNEGPAVLLHDGKVFLTYSASATGPEYCIGLLYADQQADLLDPGAWAKAKKPLLTSRDLEGEYGPGHNSFTVDEQGNPVLIYHSRDEACYQGECGYGEGDPLYDPCRSARLRRVHWDEAGMPVLKR